ncbi:hypothetical protein P7C70_g8985, partial [Phenoliferia sp. Uapishka_3]
SLSSLPSPSSTNKPQPSLLKAKSWILELQRQADPQIIVCLAGNKLDLASTQRAVTTEEAQAFANAENLLFFEVSAKSAEGVEGLFAAIADKLPLDLPSVKPRAGGAGLAARNGGVDLSSGGAGGADGACAC